MLIANCHRLRLYPCIDRLMRRYARVASKGVVRGGGGGGGRSIMAFNTTVPRYLLLQRRLYVGERPSVTSLIKNVIINIVDEASVVVSGGLAQLAERLLCMQKVTGSIPVTSILLRSGKVTKGRSLFRRTMGCLITLKRYNVALLLPLLLCDVYYATTSLARATRMSFT